MESPVSWNEVERAINEAINGQFDEGVPWRGNNLPASHRVYIKLLYDGYLIKGLPRNCRWGSFEAHYDNMVEAVISEAIDAHVIARKKNRIGPSVIRRIYQQLAKEQYLRPEFIR